MICYSFAGVGSRDNPIHVVSIPGRMGILRELWGLVRFIIILFVGVSLISSVLVNPMKTGSECMPYSLLTQTVT